MRDLLPCPFCRSTNLRRAEMYYDDDGEHEGIECLDCDTSAREDRWNQRPVCEWKADGYAWETGCETTLTLFGAPDSYGMSYCYRCGGKVEVV